jgi:hypothetical protein
MTDRIGSWSSDFVAYLITATCNGDSVQAIAAADKDSDSRMTADELESRLLSVIKPYADERFGEGADFKFSWVKSTQSTLKMDS